MMNLRSSVLLSTINSAVQNTRISVTLSTQLHVYRNPSKNADSGRYDYFFYVLLIPFPPPLLLKVKYHYFEIFLGDNIFNNFRGGKTSLWFYIFMCLSL